MKSQVLKIFFVALFIILTSPLFSYSQDAPSLTLYQRLGGVNAVAAVVDDFVERLLTNAVVTQNENVLASLQRITKAGLKYQLTGFICEATGGPEKYTGRSMKDSHSHLNISEAQWQATVQELKTSLAKFSVPENEQNELLEIVGTTKSDIVTATSPAPIPIPEVEAPSVNPSNETPIPDKATTPPSPPAQLIPTLESAPQGLPEAPLPDPINPEAQIAPQGLPELPLPDPIDPEAQVAPPAEPDTEIEGAQVVPPPEPDSEKAQVAPPPEPGTDTTGLHITPPANALPLPKDDESASYDKFLDDDLYQFDESGN